MIYDLFFFQLMGKLHLSANNSMAGSAGHEKEELP